MQDSIQIDSKTSNRNGGLDIFRIILCFFIIIGHMQSQSFIMDMSIKDGLCDYLFETIFGNAERTAINGFIMISSWYLIGRKFSAKRFVTTWFMVFILNVLITILMFLSSAVPFSVVYFIQSFLPIIGRPQWYMCEYLLLLLTIPFLNKILDSLNIRALRLLLIIGAMFIIGSATIIPIKYTQPMFSEYIWFVYIFLLMGYCKKTNVRFIKNDNNWLIIAAIAYLFIVALMLIGNLTCYTNPFIGEKILAIGKYYCDHYEALPAFLCSFALFMWFKSRRVKGNKRITDIARATGTIYIIHTVPVFYWFDDFKIWENVFHISYWYEKNLLIIAMILITMIVICLGTIIFWIYEFLFSRIIIKTSLVKLVIRWLDEKYHAVEYTPN